MLNLPDLPAHLMQLMGQVPPGRVTTYRALAVALGDAIATRWVGSFLLNHDHDGACSCHRVVQSTGQVGNFIGGNPIEKRNKLEAEGIGFHNDQINLEFYALTDFDTDKPLVKLCEQQTALAEKLSLIPPRNQPDIIGGVDVSYSKGGDGVAAYVNVDAKTGQRLWTTTVRRNVNFPYISSYLAFRELPLLLDVIANAKEKQKLAPVVLVDGTGILHPRQSGIASHLGILTDLSTIGVTKKLLCGEVRLTGIQPHAPRTIIHNEKPSGIAIQSKPNTKPIYLSPGHNMSLGFLKTLLPKLFTSHKLPEPLYWADKLSREVANEKTIENSLFD
jgi:deoxyribonuclease V